MQNQWVEGDLEAQANQAHVMQGALEADAQLAEEDDESTQIDTRHQFYTLPDQARVARVDVPDVDEVLDGAEQQMLTATAVTED